MLRFQQCPSLEGCHSALGTGPHGSTPAFIFGHASAGRLQMSIQSRKVLGQSSFTAAVKHLELNAHMWHLAHLPGAICGI